MGDWNNYYYVFSAKKTMLRANRCVGKENYTHGCCWAFFVEYDCNGLHHLRLNPPTVFFFLYCPLCVLLRTWSRWVGVSMETVIASDWRCHILCPIWGHSATRKCNHTTPPLWNAALREHRKYNSLSLFTITLTVNSQHAVTDLDRGHMACTFVALLWGIEMK